MVRPATTVQSARKSTGPILRDRQIRDEPGSSSGSRARFSDPHRPLLQTKRKSLWLKTCEQSVQRNERVQEQSIARHVQQGQGIGKGGLRRMRQIMRVAQDEQRQEHETVRRQVTRLPETDLMDSVISARHFNRFVFRVLKSIVDKNDDPDKVSKMQAKSLEVLRHAATCFLVRFFEQCSMAVTHASRVTLMPRDIRLAVRMDDAYLKLGLSRL